MATRGGLPGYSINGVDYLSLVSLCDAKGINWEYDLITRNILMSKDKHRINLRLGEKMVLVDGVAQYLKHPVDIYEGTVVVPLNFKGQILDSLFKEYIPLKKITMPTVLIKKVVIDAGHGGNDPGAIGRTGSREKHVNLDIAKRLGTLLKQEGIQVIMTRSTDSFIPLERRVNIANDAQADLFVSVHSNASRVKSLTGFEVYYPAFDIDDSRRALYAAEHAKLNLGDSFYSTPTLNLKATLWDIIYNYDRAESIRLGRLICNVVQRDLNCKILGVKGARFQVLKGARVPAVLVEVGFLSNSGEENFLKNSYYRQKIAQGIKDAILDYARDY
ncbi:MAG: N-acetylmuramoyl-L-alanine amidase [Candidatus Omnitrophica bacterium]|nr:N-acetylmuramoyl-L-alanine amidase [Candidatus Omnitrophota bacterium]